jgi:hypothetical protein
MVTGLNSHPPKGEVFMSFAANSTMRRQFVKEISFGAAGLTVAGSMSAWAAADETKHSHLIKKIVYNLKKERQE